MRGLTFAYKRILFDGKDFIQSLKSKKILLFQESFLKKKKFISGHTCFKTAKAREIWQQRKIWVGGASAVASVVVSSFPVSHTLVPCRHYNCECVYVPHFIICYAQAHSITPLSSLSTVGLLDMKTFQTFFFKSDFKKYLIWPPFTALVLSWIKQKIK